MNFLPLLERELRVRARGRAGYWTRCGVALGGLLVCLPLLMSAGPMGTPGSLGNAIFNSLVAAAFLLSCTACLVTAGGVATEQKEGTLQLLFLTRVKALDVLLGKLGSAGLTSLCGLLAFVPVLMLPLLAGGVTGREAFRKGLALLATLSFALAAGLWASTSRRPSSVMRVALGMVCLVALVPYGFWRFAANELKWVGVLSPLVAVVAAGDSRLPGGWYWPALVGVSLLTALALLAAGLRLRRLTQPEPMVEPAPQEPFTLFGKELTPRVPWSRGDEAGPVAWLVRRQPGLRTRLWLAAIISLLNHTGSLFWWRLFPRSAWSVFWGPSFVLSGLESAFIAWAASRFFIDGRHSAELELLLTTPVGARQVVAGQWRALQRALRWPVGLMLLPAFLQLAWFVGTMAGHVTVFPGAFYPLRVGGSLALSLVGVVIHVATLCWLGMWFGLKARSQPSAIAWSALLGTALPYVVNAVFYTILSLLLPGAAWGMRAWYSLFLFYLPQVAVLGFTFALMVWAKGRLAAELSGAAPGRFSLEELVSGTMREASSAVRKARQWTPS